MICKIEKKYCPANQPTIKTVLAPIIWVGFYKTATKGTFISFYTIFLPRFYGFFFIHSKKKISQNLIFFSSREKK